MSDLLVIGLGNMGKALVKGMLNSGIDPKNIHAVDISEQAKLCATEMGITLYNKPPQRIKPSLVLISIKPQMLNEILPLYQVFTNPNCVFISIVAGATIARFEKILGKDACIIRTMPNTPAAIGKGMTVLFANTNTTNKQKEEAQKLLATTGETAWIENEELMDTVTAISGSGPAYFFLIMEALTKAGVENGLSKELSQKLAVTTAWGAGNLAKQQETTHSPEQLRIMVTSPNGTTEAGLKILTNKGIEEIFKQTVISAKTRSKELA